MRAVILAAGEGARLRPLTHDRPKPMLPVGSKPLLEHTILWLKSHGIKELAINLHHCPEVVTSYLETGARWGVSIQYSQEEEILGTGGALRKLRSVCDATFVVVYGDVLTDLDLTRLIEYHFSRRREDSRCVATLSLYHVPDPSQCGIVELDSENRITKIVEKPKPEEAFGDLAFSGVMISEPALVCAIPSEGFWDLGFHTLPVLLKNGSSLYGLPIDSAERLIDIGTPARYESVRRGWPAQTRRC